MSIEIIQKYFPDLNEKQIQRFSMIYDLYKDWNEKINVVSRKDMEHLMIHHVLHSLAIAKKISFLAGARILDIGTGGGFPGLPLAILFENTQFHLVDSIGKKLKVVAGISEELGLKNIKCTHSRVEQIQGSYDFILSRAVAETSVLLNWTKQLLNKKNQHQIPNGWLLLKGGSLGEELSKVDRRYVQDVTHLQHWFSEPFFETKLLVYLHQ